MKPKFLIYCVSVMMALSAWVPVRSVFGKDILYEDEFTNLDPSWDTPGDILSVKEGKLVLKPALNTTQSVLNQSNVFDDADIEVQVALASGDPIVPAGLIFWAKDYTGFRDLAAGACDIGMSSRWISPEEAKQCAAAGLGDMYSPACENVLGLDGIAVVVHNNNPLNALTKEQLAASQLFENTLLGEWCPDVTVVDSTTTSDTA